MGHPGILEIYPPLIAGVLTGVVRGVTLARGQNPQTVTDWRKYFVTYDRVLVTTFATGSMIVLWAIVVGAVPMEPDFFPVGLLFGLAIMAVYGVFVGGLIGIPIAAVVCVLIHGVWLCIDAVTNRR